MDKAEAVDLMLKDNYLEVGAAIAMAVVGIAAFLALPVLVGVLTDGYGLSASQAGYHTAVGTSGGIAASILISLLLDRLNSRLILFLGLLICALGNLANALGPDYNFLLVIAFATGLGGGAVYALGIALIAGTVHTGKNFSILLFSQGAFSGLALFFLPRIAESFGPPSIFIALMITFVLSMPLVLLITKTANFVLETIDEIRSETIKSDELAITSGNRVLPWLCLVSIFFFYLAVGSFWTYVERLGAGLGMKSESIADALTIGNMLALGGCGVAYWLSERVGHSRPLLFGLFALAISFALLGTNINVNEYLVGVFVFFLMWNFIDIFQLGTLSAFDHAGRYVALVPAFQSVGTAIGPALSGWLLSGSWVLADIMAFNSTIVGVAFIGYLAVFILQRNEN